jgi:hypothetical protein
MNDQTQNEIRRIFRLLQPYTAEGFQKVRFGCMHDGGYILLDDFRGIDTAFSFGIEANASWDVDVANRGATVYQFDHTVDAPITDNPQLIFAKKKITTEFFADSESATLSSLIEHHDKCKTRPNMLLKMDIENNEWDVLDTTPPEVLARLTQIVAEFHYFQSIAEPHWRHLYARVLKKMSDCFAVVHIHANNFAGFANVANVMLPNMLEITFANRNVYSFGETNELFPGPLDSPNDAGQPDMYLGTFRF